MVILCSTARIQWMKHEKQMNDETFSEMIDKCTINMNERHASHGPCV